MTVAGGCFAGHCDWRVPNIAELRTLVDCSSPSCIDPIFGPTAAASYWSSSSVAGFPADAWAVDFLFGIVFTENKSEVGPGPVRLYARAVRGGP